MIAKLVFLTLPLLFNVFQLTTQDEKFGPMFVIKGIECISAESPWECTRQKLVKALDLWDENLQIEREALIEEMNAELTNSSRRGREMSEGEEPSSILQSALDDVDEITQGVAESLGSEDPAETAAVPDADATDENESATTEVSESAEETVDVVGEARGKGNKKKGGYYGHDYDYGYYRGKFGKGKGNKGGKKKKGYMKIFMIGAALKAKLEMLLKLLSFHLQLKFFAIASIGLIVNIARFWLDVKKGQAPQKVIYYEHAQHHHNYDEHGDDFGGSYWKRSNEPYNYGAQYGYDLQDNKA